MKNSTFYVEFVYFASLLKNYRHVHHLIGCSKKKATKKKSDLPTVTGNIQLILLGLSWGGRSIPVNAKTPAQHFYNVEPRTF